MDINLNPLDEYVKTIKRNTNFLKRLISPRISIPLFMICLMVVSIIVLTR